MAVRKGSAEWNGNLIEGKGTLSSETGVLSNIAYNFKSRFEQGSETNPEELLGAAHAACFSMALANVLSKEGFKVNSIKTVDDVHLEKLEGGFTITKIVINTEGNVEGIDEATFLKHADATKEACPVSRALKIEKVINAKLV
jgi:osmotically inducible protein OsmC